MNEKLPSLQTNTTDYVTSLAKGTFGAIPFIGPIAAEIIGHIIPNQRADRIVRFVELLEERVSHLEGSDFVERCLQTDAVDLFEDALHQAARSKSQDRLEYIANIVTHGLTDEEQNQAEASKMLWLLGQLNDAEIIILRSRLATTNEDLSADGEFRKTHTDVLAPDVTHLGSSEDELEEAAIKRSYRKHLHDLGLIRQRFKKPKRGEFPEFDETTGMIKASGTDTTRLGRMLLRYLNLIPSWYRH